MAYSGLPLSLLPACLVQTLQLCTEVAVAVEMVVKVEVAVVVVAVVEVAALLVLPLLPPPPLLPAPVPSLEKKARAQEAPIQFPRSHIWLMMDQDWNPSPEATGQLRSLR